MFLSGLVRGGAGVCSWLGVWMPSVPGPEAMVTVSTVGMALWAWATDTKAQEQGHDCQKRQQLIQ